MYWRTNTPDAATEEGGKGSKKRYHRGSGKGRRVSDKKDYDYFLPPKPGIGQSKCYGLDAKIGGHKDALVDEGTVIEALRGWPGIHKEGEREDEMHAVYFDQGIL